MPGPSLPALPGPAVQQLGGSSKGAFMQGFVQALTQSVNQLVMQRQQKEELDRRHKQSTYMALLQSGDEELIPIGLAGLIDEKAGKTGNIDKIKASPTYQQLTGLTQRIFEGSSGDLAAGGSGEGVGPAAMPTSTIPKGTAAGAALPMGASLEPPPPAHVAPEDFKFEQNLLGASAPVQPEVPPPAAPAGGGYDEIFRTLGDLRAKARFSPVARNRIDKAIELVRVGQTSGVLPEAMGKRLMDEMSPASARIESSMGGRLVEISAAEALKYGIPVPEGVESIKVDARRLTQAGATTRTEATITGANERAANKPRRLQIVWSQGVSGGMRKANYVDPATNTLTPLTHGDGKPVVDAPEFRQQITRDAQGNEFVNWVLPGGSGGGETGLTPPPAGPAATPSSAPAPSGTPSPTRVSPRVRELADKFSADPVVKRTQVIAEGANFALGLDNNTTNPADDIGLLYSFAKTMDPDSVVREGEYATVQKYAQSWAEKFGFDVQRIFSNTAFLTPQARANMKSTIQQKFGASRKMYENVRQQYGKQIGQVTGEADGTKHLLDLGAGFPNTTDAIEEWVRDASGKLVKK